MGNRKKSLAVMDICVGVRVVRNSFTMILLVQTVKNLRFCAGEIDFILLSQRTEGF